jgi:hypothetical protein
VPEQAKSQTAPTRLVTNYAATHIRHLLSRFRERIVATALERNSNQKAAISPAETGDEMFAAKCPAKMLKGLSFDIPDLLTSR